MEGAGEAGQATDGEVGGGSPGYTGDASVEEAEARCAAGYHARQGRQNKRRLDAEAEADRSPRRDRCFSGWYGAEYGRRCANRGERNIRAETADGKTRRDSCSPGRRGAQLGN